MSRHSHMLEEESEGEAESQKVWWHSIQSQVRLRSPVARRKMGEIEVGLHTVWRAGDTVTPTRGAESALIKLAPTGSQAKKSEKEGQA